ncbi:MAG TPA: FtsX-like permease family protein, partial [Pseudomonadaceae bacterium]|nr:FtsX-like permease family protein [Pseudomonadaceae bacterium]
PFLLFRVHPQAFVISLMVSITASSAGGLLVLRQVFALTPAAAMSPPTPPDFSRSLRFGAALRSWLDQPSRMVIRNLWRQPVRALASVAGLSLGLALSAAILSMLAAFDTLLDDNFGVINRSQMGLTFVEAQGPAALYELQQLPGVLKVEPFRVVAAQLHNGRHQYRGAITALSAAPELFRAMDSAYRPIALRDDGLVVSRSLAEELNLKPGDLVRAEIREGRRPTLQLPVVAIADSMMGSPVYLSLEALGRAMKEPDRISGVWLAIDTARQDALYQRLQDLPAVAGVSLSADSRAAFAKVMDSGAGAMRYVMAAIAAIITFGIVYNSARTALAERMHDLASLRVLGLTRSETGFVLLGELALLVLLALPLGAAAGYYLVRLVSIAFSTDLYRVPGTFVPESFGVAVCAMLLAALVSGWLVKRDLDRVDLVAALKVRE